MLGFVAVPVVVILKVLNLCAMLTLLVLVSTLGFDGGGPTAQRLREEGRLQLTRLTEMSRLPASGSCWKDAVRSLRESCDGLSSDAQARVALSLTDCFLQASGRPATGCGGSDVVEEDRRVHCTASMASEAFQAYTVFYTHTHSICFFLRGEIWHEETERTIQRLAEASTQVTSHMETLSQFLSVSHEALLGAVSELQSWGLGETSWFRAVAFYVASLLVALVASASTRTSGARPWLCLLLTLNLAAECYVPSWWISHEASLEERILGGRLWASWARGVTLAICAALLAAKFFLYRDFPQENNRLLREIKGDTTQLIRTARPSARSRQADWLSRTVYTGPVGEPRPKYGYPAVPKRDPAPYDTPLRDEAWLPGELRHKYSYHETEELSAERPTARPLLHRRPNGAHATMGAQRSSTPLPDAPPLTRRDFYTPERELSREHSQDPRLRATPVVVLRPLDLLDQGEQRSRRGSSVASNHSYGLRSSVQRL